MPPPPPPFATTAVGSFPHTDVAGLARRLIAALDLPCWPQLPRRDFREGMIVQYSPPLPGIRLEEPAERITFDTTADLSEPLEQFYTHYLADDLEAFGLRPEYAAGFYAYLDALGGTAGEWAKGQVTGPITFGMTVTDQDRRASAYDEQLFDAIVKSAAANARWQIRRLRACRPNVMIFVDEPYLAAFGSAYFHLSREQVIAALDELFAAIHQEGAWAGVHCCANTDWSLLMATSTDIINLDAFGFLENLALYPAELRAFLDRGGRIAWGIVPNSDAIHELTPADLAGRLSEGFEQIGRKARARGVEIAPPELAARSLLAPSCGLGSTSIETADRVIDALGVTAAILRQEYA
jgi:methionine synthase II (cobalamin-independent)